MKLPYLVSIAKTFTLTSFTTVILVANAARSADLTMTLQKESGGATIAKKSPVVTNHVASGQRVGALQTSVKTALLDSSPLERALHKRVKTPPGGSSRFNSNHTSRCANYRAQFAAWQSQQRHMNETSGYLGAIGAGEWTTGNPTTGQNTYSAPPVAPAGCK